LVFPEAESLSANRRPFAAASLPLYIISRTKGDTFSFFRQTGRKPEDRPNLVVGLPADTVALPSGLFVT
jgi:hypothetical protein